MKIGIIGHSYIGAIGSIDHEGRCLTSEIIRTLEKHGAEVIVINPKECFDRGITISNTIKDEALNSSLALSVRDCMPFTPPITRRERRKLKRKKKK